MKSEIKVKMGKNNRNKGANYEREIAKHFSDIYPELDLKRTPQSGGFAKSSTNSVIKGDISNLNEEMDFNLHIECKNQKSLALFKWYDQAREECPQGKTPIVIFKKQQKIEEGKVVQKKDDYVCLRLEDFLSMLKETTSYVTKKE